MIMFHVSFDDDAFDGRNEGSAFSPCLLGALPPCLLTAHRLLVVSVPSS